MGCPLPGGGGLLRPLHPEGGEGGELVGVKPVTALFLVDDPYSGAVLGSVGELLDVRPSGESTAFPFEVLGEGLYALVERLGAPPDRGRRIRRRGRRTGPWGPRGRYSEGGESGRDICGASVGVRGPIRPGCAQGLWAVRCR